MGWHTILIVKAPMLNKAIRYQDWMLGAVHGDSLQIPPRAMCRIRTILLKGCDHMDLLL